MRNCPNLTQAVDVSGCSNLEHVYFDGTGITGLLLPVGGILKTLHLPATITNLTIRNQMSLHDLSIPSYAGISTLRLENVSGAVDSRAILEAIPVNSRVRLIGIDWAAGTADTLMEIIALLDSMRGLDEAGNNTDMAQVSGTISVDTVTGAQLAEIAGKYPDIHVAYQHITSNLYFYNEDGSTLLYTQAIVDGGDGTYSGSTPTKASTAQYTYSFAGWSKKPGGTADSTALKAVTADRQVYAAFTASVRKYTVYFYNGSTLLQRVDNVPYGGSATYTGDTPVSSEGSAEDYPFEGWVPTGKNITGSTSCYAQFGSALEVKEIADDWATIIANIDNGTYKSKYKIGNYKPLDLGSEGVINMQIAGFDVDDLADGTGKAPITFISKELLAEKKAVLNTGEYMYKSWATSPLRSYLQDTLKLLIPEVVRNRIGVVKKETLSDVGSTWGAPVSEETVWAPSRAEVSSDDSWREKIRYKVLFPLNDDDLRKKYIYNKESEGTQMWATRSGWSSLYVVRADGTLKTNNESQQYVCFGFCLRGPREIPDTWEEIFAAEADGSYKTKYKVSDYKPLDLGSEGIINMQIAGFDVDDLADGTGKAPITWISREIIGIRPYVNPEEKINDDGTYQIGTGTIGGWEKCYLRTWLYETIKSKMPDDIKNSMVKVIKTQNACDINRNDYAQTTIDDIWAPGLNEVFGASSKYVALFPTDMSRVKINMQSRKSESWILRDTHNDGYCFKLVTKKGYGGWVIPQQLANTTISFCT